MSANPIERVSGVSGRAVEQGDHPAVWTPPTGSTAEPDTEAPGDTAQLSPFAQFVAVLEDLRSSDSAKYAQVSRKVAAILDRNAEIARSQGNASAARQLEQLSADFLEASTSGNLLQDLSAAVGQPEAGSGFIAILETAESHSAQTTALDSVAILVETESSSR